MTGPRVDIWECPQCGYGFVAANYAAAFHDGAKAMQAASVTMLERAKQPAAALGISLMKLPEVPK